MRLMFQKEILNDLSRIDDDDVLEEEQIEEIKRELFKKGEDPAELETMTLEGLQELAENLADVSLGRLFYEMARSKEW